MKRRGSRLSALLGVVLLGLVACDSPTGPEDREPKDDTDGGPKRQLAVVGGSAGPAAG